MTLTEKKVSELIADHHEKHSTSVTSFNNNETKDWDLSSFPSFNYFLYNDEILKECEEEMLFADIEIEIKL